MEEHDLSSAKNLQNKFREWFRDLVSTNPPFPAQKNRLAGDVQKKFGSLVLSGVGCELG
jgi:hypothetical protein